ncbi:hypothetical protein ACTA71_009495 [Dictyostelium dimigraforme]
MKLKLFSLLLLLFLFNINKSNGNTILLYADKCTNLGCAFSSLFSSAPSILDDVIVKTNSSAIQAIITLTESMSMKSLNISNGILKVAASGSLTVANNILVQIGSSLSIDGTSTCNSLILNGGGSINLGGTLNVNNQLSCDGSVKGGSIKINGTLNVKSLNLMGINSPIPIVYQNGILNLNGNANFSSGLTLNDNSQINIKSGICTIDGLLTTTTNSIIHNLATLNIINSVIDSTTTTTTTIIKNITCGIKFDSNSITNFIGSKCNIFNIVMITPTSTINLQSLASISISNHQSSLITFGPINIDSTSSLTFDNSNCLLSKSLSLVKGSLINLNNNSTVTIGVGIDLLNDFNIDINSVLIIQSSSTNSIIGTIKCSIGSIIKIVNSIVNFNSPIIIDTLLIDKSTSTSIHIVSNVTINNGIECIAPLSQITIDPVIGLLNLGGKSIINNVLNLSGSSQFNLINKASCILSGLVPIEKAIVNIFQGSNLTITTSTNLTNCLNLHGDSILQINANAILSGLTVYPISQLNLPILNIKDSTCNLLGSIDQLGTINLINSELSLADKVVLNINNNLITDQSSNIILPVNANLIIGGPNSIISNLFSFDGKLNIESGSITFNGGINASVSSFLFCNNAKVSIGGASSNFNGPFSVTGSSGSISISNGVVHFYQGIQIPTTKCPFNILKSSTCTIHSASVISSPVYCLNDATLNIVSQLSSTTAAASSQNVVQFEGGLFTDINSMLSIDNSIFSLNSTSLINGVVMLNESQLVSCGQTTFQNGIDSIIQGKEGNNTLLINSGSCLINTTNSIELSGSIDIMEKAFLSIRSPNTTCHRGIKNSGSLLIGSVVDLKNSMINQLNGDATLELLQGSNLITTGANFASGIVSGSGKITITKSTTSINSSIDISSSGSTGQCESGGILSGWITIDGPLKLLESSVLRVNIVSSTNVSKIICTESTIINGLIDVLFDTDTVEETLTKGMIFPVLSSSISITGNLSLSDTLDSKQFSCKPQQQQQSSSSTTTTGSEYSLVYQQTNVPSNKVASTQDSTNSSTSINNSFSFYLLLISLLISFLYL